MTSFFTTLRRFVIAFLHGLRDPEFRALLLVLVVLLVSGTIFYASVEGWGVVDSLYFCVMTLSTVGQGELQPTGTLAKVFTMIYVLVGVGVFVAFVAKVAVQERHSGRNHTCVPQRS